MVLISKYFVPKGYSGLTIFPFVFLKYSHLKTDKILMNHEHIHLRQQLEMIIVLFYLFYAVEFVIRLCQYKNWYKAYKNISFEREAYHNESNMDYLEQRSFWSFLKYLSAHDV